MTSYSLPQRCPSSRPGFGNAAATDPKIKARLAELGGTTLAGAPADFGKHVAAETEKWSKVIKFAGIKPG